MLILTLNMLTLNYIFNFFFFYYIVLEFLFREYYNLACASFKILLLTVLYWLRSLVGRRGIQHDLRIWRPSKCYCKKQINNTRTLNCNEPASYC